MSTSIERPRRLPGDLAMWWFILAELAVFGILLMAFAVAQHVHQTMFHSGKALLDGRWGMWLTVALITSGLFAALALQSMRKGRRIQSVIGLISAFFSASVYVVLKLQEYGHLLDLGLDIERNIFFTLYWIVTGFHFLHVLLGMVILLLLALGCALGRFDGDESSLESGILYWHMVDLVWVLLFPLIYVLP